jgi:hypothetical protein
MRCYSHENSQTEIDGVDLGGHEAGDILNVPGSEARLLVAEQWAIPDRRAVDRPQDLRERSLLQAS